MPPTYSHSTRHRTSRAKRFVSLTFVQSTHVRAKVKTVFHKNVFFTAYKSGVYASVCPSASNVSCVGKTLPTMQTALWKASAKPQGRPSPHVGLRRSPYFSLFYKLMPVTRETYFRRPSAHETAFKCRLQTDAVYIRATLRSITQFDLSRFRGTELHLISKNSDQFDCPRVASIQCNMYTVSRIYNIYAHAIVLKYLAFTVFFLYCVQLQSCASNYHCSE